MPLILTINGGSSSIKFAVFDGERRVLGGNIERIGLPGTVLTSSAGRAEIGATSHRDAAGQLIEWLAKKIELNSIAGVGHRVVHGGTAFTEHQKISDAMIAELRKIQALDLAHLPAEIALIEIFRERFPNVAHVACFDTAFHREMPRVAKLLPIPRRYDATGVRRFGFHGISYAYLLRELTRIAPGEAKGRVIFAHLGSGASMAAVRGGQAIDTSMGFTPTAGIMMGTRPGDLDPGVLVHVMRSENASADELDNLISKRCGLLGVSETSFDMRDLLARRAGDVRAAEAVELFCYSAKKYIGAFAAALGGLDALVFSGGIGEHSVEVRAEICAGLEFLGIEIDIEKNAKSDGVISRGRLPVRVIKTDEELMMSEIVRLKLNADKRG